MKIHECMKPNVVSIPATATIGEAVVTIIKERIGILPVVNEEGRLVGMVPLWTLLDLIMPDFIQLIENFDYVHDFGILESRLPDPEILSNSIQEVMLPPISVEETNGLLMTAAKIHRRNLSDILVVSAQGQLVGIASRVDIGVALLSKWNISSSSDT